jgi:histone acetyltransferase (RNA polymerase elongator complex component)
MGLVIPVFISHRGCPHQCLFCNQHAITGRGEGAITAGSDIVSTIETWLTRSPGHEDVQVAFYGGSFTCLACEEQQRMLSLVTPFIAAGRVKSIRLSTRPDCLNEDIVRLLQDSGVKTVELGVQSLDDEVLLRAQRGHNADDSRMAMQRLREAGLEVGVQLLPGLPGETTQSFFRGVREVVSFRPDLVRLYPAVVVHHSELAEIYHQGVYTPLSLNRAVALTCRARELFDAAGIPVVRMGLQPSEALEKQVVAGPYHPAFGELVVSRNWFRRIRRQLRMLQDGQKLEIHISHRDHSAVAGMKKMNIRRFEALGFEGRFTIISEKSRERGSIEYVVC